MDFAFTKENLRSPPIQLVVDPTLQLWSTLIHGVILAAVIVFICRKSRREYLMTSLAILVGAGLSVFLEPLADHIGSIWHYSVGQWTVIASYGHSTAVWLFLVYVWYVGGQTIYLLHWLRKGGGYRTVWILYAAFMAADFVLEVPALWSGKIYTYYGDQPLWWPPYMPLPLWYVTANGLLPVWGALAVTAAERLLGKWRNAAIVLLIPASAVGIFTATAFPVCAALNSDVSSVVRTIAAFVTIGLCCLAADMAARLLALSYGRPVPAALATA